MYWKLIQKLIENSSKLKIFTLEKVSSGNEIPDWKGLIGGGLTRGFTKFDMSFLSVSVSIFDCFLISFVLETDTEIDRKLI